MSERASSAERLTREFVALGVRPDRDLLVHCSMRRVGLVPGGAATVLGALRVAAGPASTLVVPTQTQGNSLTSNTFRTATADLGQAERAAYIATIPGFDPATSPSVGMGALAEVVRTSPGAVRSAHPQSSFAAIGPRAVECMAGHEMNCHLGERSPLGWLYRHDAYVLLLGVSYAVCTAFHLAEYRLPGPAQYRRYGCFTATDRGRTEHSFTDIRLDTSDFDELGSHVDNLCFVRRGVVGHADCKLMPIRAVVDFATSWPPFAQRRRLAPIYPNRPSAPPTKDDSR